MPPRYASIQGGPPPSKGFFKSTYDTLTSADNASMVRSIAAFGVAVAFLSSSWSEWLSLYDISLPRRTVQAPPLTMAPGNEQPTPA
ncbi:hypothetical protein GQ53DRAFT_826840 [Thozetella sp. PMI_491]|nr:hypothetical protein GQ53DRAFT_826840 [Thozetella sp. PMI_491]